MTIKHETKLHEALATLKAARDYLADEKHWVKGTLGDNNDEHGTFAPAQVVCAWGAISKVTQKSPEEMGYDKPSQFYECAPSILNEVVRGTSDHVDIVSMNDNDETSHADLLGYWDLAIEECEKRIREYEAGKHMEGSND